MQIRLAQIEDIDRRMELMEKVKSVFPGLETQEALLEHRATVLRFIEDRSAICATDGIKLVGALLFSAETNTLCFLAVDPLYRRQHIAQNMVVTMLGRMDNMEDITVTTYREGDPNGIAARAFYKSLGFCEGTLTEEFGSSVQQFVLKREAAT